MKATKSIICLFTLFCLFPTSGQSLTLDVIPMDQKVTIGDLVYFDIVISDLVSGGAPSISAFDLDVSFDESILAFDSVTFGDAILGDQLDLWMLGSVNGSSHSVGSVNIFELSFDLAVDLEDFQADEFTIASFSFSTLSTGTSGLGLSVNSIGDSWGISLITDTINLNSANVTVAPVPEPATFLLFGAGVAGLATFRRRGQSPQKNAD